MARLGTLGGGFVCRAAFSISGTMAELKKQLVLIAALLAFLAAAYSVGGGTWRGSHNLRKSLPAKGAKIGMQEGRYGCDGYYVSVRG
jgi:hypothetical protein